MSKFNVLPKQKELNQIRRPCKRSSSFVVHRSWPTRVSKACSTSFLRDSVCSSWKKPASNCSKEIRRPRVLKTLLKGGALSPESANQIPSILNSASMQKVALAVSDFLQMTVKSSKKAVSTIWSAFEAMKEMQLEIRRNAVTLPTAPNGKAPTLNSW